MMRAISYDHFGGPDVLQVIDLPEPEPGPHQVRVRLHAASVIPGDCKLRAGRLTNIFTISFPKIPGRDGAGVITRLGPGVTDIAAGTPVCVVAQHTQPGTYAEAIVVDRDSVVPLPEGLSFEEGAALMHAGVCAWICLEEAAQIQPGMKVLIHGGAGAIGGMAIQLARHKGAHVATTCRASNAGYVKALGAHDVIADDRDDFTRAANDFDVVLDLIGGEVHERSYAALKPGGHMVCLIAEPFIDRSKEFAVRVTTPQIHDRPAALQAVVDLASAGVLKPQICDRLPLEEAPEAHRRLEAGGVTRGRLVLQVNQAVAF